MKRLTQKITFLLLVVMGISLTAVAVTDEINSIAEQADKLYNQQRYSEAFPLMKRAAEGGDLISMFNLGTMYYEGLGTKQDLAQARHWWQEAANRGDTLAQKWLKRLDEINSIAEQAYKLCVEKRYSEAFPLMKRAAEGGDVISMGTLGTMYYEGKGTSIDLAQARHWWQEAANRGDSDARDCLKRLDAKQQEERERQEREIQAIVQKLINDMVYVEGGTFMMGATSEQGSYAYDDEKPAHRVTVSSFHISKYEVTQALWQAVMGSNPSIFQGDLQCPVDFVSWKDCQSFITKLNQLTGKRFRLPTEAEWEYAARGGNKSRGYKYSGSNNLDDVAWYDNSGGKPHPVGTKAPNELGLYDMSGNVCEWCQDWYDENYYSSSPSSNPTGPSRGISHVLRGGGCKWGVGSVSDRFTLIVDYGTYLGLRLAL